MTTAGTSKMTLLLLLLLAGLVSPGLGRRPIKDLGSTDDGLFSKDAGSSLAQETRSKTKCCRLTEVGRLVHISGTAVYGVRSMGSHSKRTEPAWTRLSDPTKPQYCWQRSYTFGRSDCVNHEGTESIPVGEKQKASEFDHSAGAGADWLDGPYTQAQVALRTAAVTNEPQVELVRGAANLPGGPGYQEILSMCQQAKPEDHCSRKAVEVSQASGEPAAEQEGGVVDE